MARPFAATANGWCRLREDFWRRFVPRLALGYLVLFVIGWLGNNGNWLFSGARPHPFLLLVVWASVSFGWGQGLLTGVVSSILVALNFRFSPDARFENDLDTQFLLPVVALWVGLLTENSRKRMSALRVRVARQASTILTQAEKLEVLELANGSLREHAQEVDAGLALVHQIAGRLYSLTQVDEVNSVLVNMVANSLGADRCSYYARQGDERLRLVAHFGWPTVPVEARFIKVSQDLVSQALERKTLQTIRDYPSASLEPQGQVEYGSMLRLMAAPVVHPSSGVVLGVLSVESLPFVRFTQANAKLLTAICDLAGKVLAQLQMTDLGQSRESDKEDFLSSADFLRHLRREVFGLRRGARPSFCLFGLRVDGLQKIGPELYARVERAIALVARVNLRAVDKRGRWGEQQYAFILTDSPVPLVERLLVELPMQLSDYLPLWLPEARGVSFMVNWRVADFATEPEILLEQLMEGVHPWTRLNVL